MILMSSAFVLGIFSETTSYLQFVKGRTINFI